MAIFNSYVKLPEGIFVPLCDVRHNYVKGPKGKPCHSVPQLSSSPGWPIEEHLQDLGKQAEYLALWLDCDRHLSCLSRVWASANFAWCFNSAEVNGPNYMILYVVIIVSGFLWSFRMAMNIPSFMMHQLKMAIPSIIYRSLHIDDSLFMPCCITDILEQASPIHWLRFSPRRGDGCGTGMDDYDGI